MDKSLLLHLGASFFVTLKFCAREFVCFEKFSPDPQPPYEFYIQRQKQAFLRRRTFPPSQMKFYYSVLAKVTKNNNRKGKNITSSVRIRSSSSKSDWFYNLFWFQQLLNTLFSEKSLKIRLITLIN